MRRWHAGLAAAALGAAWWLGAAPAAAGWLVGLRDSADLMVAGGGAVGVDQAPSAAQAAEAERLHERSEDWSARAASLLTADQRTAGARSAAEGGPAPAAPPRLLSVESDLWGLSVALLERHGARLGPTPAVPATDPWGGRGRRDRVLALLALVEAGALTSDQAASLLALNLETMQAQSALADLEDGRDPPEASPLAPEALGLQPSPIEDAP